MKSFWIAGLFFLGWLANAQAQVSVDDKYLAIYGVILQADGFATNGQPKKALMAYTDAQSRLQQFTKTYPGWNTNVVDFRLNDLADKISKLQNSAEEKNQTAASDAKNTESTASDTRIQQLQSQLQAVQNENALLQAKLKEAFSVQPEMVDKSELTRAQEQIRSLMKDNALLKAATATNVDDGASALRAQVATLSNEVQTLQARAEADEAKASPFSADELALFGKKDSTAEMLPKINLSAPVAVEELFAAADKHFANGDYAGAEADFQKILQSEPTNVLALTYLATTEMQDKKLDAAEKHIQAALAQDADNAHSLAVLGKIKFAQGKYDDALNALSRAAKLQPNNPETMNYLGLTYVNKGLHESAESAFRKAIQIDPNYAPAHKNLAMIYLTANPPAPVLARFHYQKALDAGGARNPDLEKMLAQKGAPVSTPQ